jgi:hypothetical protein
MMKLMNIEKESPGKPFWVNESYMLYGGVREPLQAKTSFLIELYSLGPHLFPGLNIPATNCLMSRVVFTIMKLIERDAWRGCKRSLN